MQFQVPQFIETEDKIIGPLTIKQFAYLTAGGLLLFFLYFALQFWLWLIVGGVVGLLTVALAFLRYNGRSFMILAFAIFNYFWRPRLYIWNQESGIRNQESKKGGGLSLLGLRLNTSTRPMTERREKSLRPSFLDRFRSTKEKFEVFRKLTGEREVAKRIDYR